MFEVNVSEVGRGLQADVDTLDIRKPQNKQTNKGGRTVGTHDESGWWDAKNERHNIGTCGTGLSPIPTLSSAAVSPAFIIHAVSLFFLPR